jgi:7-cyano-7-deazaguanine synthase
MQWDTIVVLSGGMDSAVLLAETLTRTKKVAGISFDYGSKHNDRELPMAQAICEKAGIFHRVVALPFIEKLFASNLLRSGGQIPDAVYDKATMQQTVVPFRNGIMLSVAVGLAESMGAGEVLLASHSGDHFIYPDCRPEFNAAFSEAARLGTDGKVSVRFPYSKIDKRQIGDLGRRLKVDFTQTWTCYKGGRIHCGTCGSCTERKYALRHDEGLDPTSYET